MILNRFCSAAGLDSHSANSAILEAPQNYPLTLFTTTEVLLSEATLVLLKPDAVRRQLTGEILRRIEQKGYVIEDLRLFTPDRELLEAHYEEHAGKPFYEPLLEFMGSGPVVAVRVAGDQVIAGFRVLAGTTDPTTAAPGTIRGDLGRDWGLKVQQNLVHGSDSPESAARELALWFGK